MNFHSVNLINQSFEHLNRIDNEGIERADAFAHFINKSILFFSILDY